MTTPHPDLSLALALADAADHVTRAWWSPHGVASTAKADGSPVTSADIGAEEAILEALRTERPGDGFLGEEIGARPSTTGRRWIVDGVDGTRAFVAGRPTWGTLIALEEHGEIVLGVASSPAQDRRWWARRGDGAFTGSCEAASRGTAIRVSTSRRIRRDRLVTKPTFDELAPDAQAAITRLAGGRPDDSTWSHQMKVAEGELDLCIWYAGNIWDHAAPSLIVQEAGGRFTDHTGGTRLDTRTAVYSNGTPTHDEVLAELGRTFERATRAESVRETRHDPRLGRRSRALRKGQ